MNEEDKNQALSPENQPEPASIQEQEAEIAEKIEREGTRHVTPPGDPEFPQDEYGFAEAPKAEETAEAVETPETPEPSAAATLAETAAPAPEASAAPAPLAADNYRDVPAAPVAPTAPIAPVAPTEPTKTDYSDQAVPTDSADIKPKWNWGAFAFPLFFGVAHKAYLGLLILLGLIPWVGPIFALVWSIIFGFHGEKWALENPDNHYRDEEEFRKIMQGWNRAGIIGFILMCVAVVLSILFFIFVIALLFNNTDFHNEFLQNMRDYNYR